MQHSIDQLTCSESKTAEASIPHNRPCLDDNDAAAAASVVSSGWVATGPRVKKLEFALSNSLFGQPDHAAVCSSGSAALYLALHILDIRSGDDVILPTYVCTAALNAVYLAGARPVLVDIDQTHLGPSLDAVRRKISDRTAAVILVHTYGIPCNPELYREFGVRIIEDCAQALGTRVGTGVPAGTIGDLAVFSFYATKTITGGYGGALVSRDPALIARAHDYLDFDCPDQYHPRFNFQLSDVNAAIALSQFQKLSRFLARRSEIADRYTTTLAGNPRVHRYNGQTGTNDFRFLLQCDSESECLGCRDFLAAHSIGSIRPLEPRELLHRYLGLDASEFPNAERVAATTLSIPVFPCLTDSQVKRICTALEEWVKR